MKYIIDKYILSRLQNFLCKWLIYRKGMYAVQFARSNAFRVSGYSTSGSVKIFVDDIYFTRKYAEEVFERCVPSFKLAKDRGIEYLHDDDLVLWEYNNGYTKELRNYQEEVFPKDKKNR